MSEADTRRIVAIYGLGNIGRRHVEGLRTIAPLIVLRGVDPDAAACAQAAAIWRAAGGEGRFDPAPPLEAADLLILATSAANRLALVKDVIARHAPRAMILEKVAFQRTADFVEAGAAAAAATVTLKVNCPRRAWPLYQRLRDRLGTDDFVLEVVGRDLGLGCNGIHFVDILQFLSGSDAVDLAASDITDVFASKRLGYWECHGELAFAAGSGRLVLRSTLADPAALTLRLRHRDRWWNVDERTGRVGADGDVAFDTGAMPYQSALTGMFARQLLDGAPSILPSLEASARAHAAMLAVLDRAFADRGIDTSRGVPIT